MDGRVEVVRQGATRLLTRVRKHRFALLGLTAYIVVLSSYSIYRYFNGQADAWDLGIMQQFLYTFAFDGRLFYYTPELFVKNPSGSFWGIHFSLLIIPLSAYYRLFPSGISLLVLQSVIVAAAAIPLRRICAELGSPDGNWIAALYLLSPMTVLSAFYDFHLEAFIPLGVFTLVLALLRRNYLWVAVAAGTTLSIYEYGAFFVAASVLFVAALHYRALPRLLTDASSWSRSTRQIVLAGAALVLLSAAYFVGAQYIIHSINPVTAQLNGSYTPEPISVGTLLPGLEFDWSSKLIFFAVPLLVLGLIPFFDPRGLVIALPFSFIALFGTADYAEFGYQYGFLILPGIILSLALGLIWLRRHRLGLRIIPWLRPVMLTVSVVSIAVIVILGTGGTFPIGSGARVYAPAGTYQAEYALAQTIPPGASVLVDSNAFPWVANNPQAYTIPIEEYPLLHPYIYSINQTVHEDAQYVLLNIEDVGVFPYFDNFSAYMQANYGVLAESDGNLLLEWHYQGPMTWDGGYTSAYPTDDFVAKPASSGFNWAGPWASLMPGEYDVDIQFIPNASGEHAFEVTAEGGQVVLLRTNATVTAPQVGIVQTLTIPLNVSWIHDGVEFLSVATPMFSAAIQSATLVENSPPPGST